MEGAVFRYTVFSHPEPCPSSGQYKNVSVLFSDIVSFAQMVKSLKPSEVCDLLTDLHKKFNRLCLVHDTFRVSNGGRFALVRAARVWRELNKTIVRFNGAF